MTDTDRLEAWVEARILSQEQAEQIRRFEAEREPDTAAAGRVPLVAEALGYLGGGLAFVAAWIFGVQLWPELQPWARVALVAVITAVIAGAGAWIRNSEEPAAQRLTSFLWFLSSIGVAFIFGLTADALDAQEETSILVGSMAVSIYSFVLWLARRSSLQQLALFAGLITTAVSLLNNFEANIDPAFFGLTIFTISLAWGLLAWGEVMEPLTTGLVVSGLGMMAGSQASAFDDTQVLGIVLGMATAVIFLVAGVVVRRMLLLALGAASVIIFVPQMINDVFGDALAAVLALLVVGLGIVVGAVVIARRRVDPGTAERS